MVACLEGEQMQGEDGRLVLPVVNGEGESGGAGRRGKSQFVPEKVTLEPGKALKERFRARAGYSFPSLPAPFRTRGHTALLPCPRIFYIYHFEI